MGQADLVSVFDFARRYRLAEKEQNRLVRLFGLSAPLAVLLANASRQDWGTP